MVLKFDFVVTDGRRRAQPTWLRPFDPIRVAIGIDSIGQIDQVDDEQRRPKGAQILWH